ncbi:hypothetical protein [Chitinimonas sp.]|uniref:alpha/beta hydrolase family protein n=1 Tax=Chitinimonas sp. TaxID=1934313 RepID=UPI002F945A69
MGCRLLVLLCLLLPAWAADYPAGPVGKVEVVLQTWHDTARDRDLPIKIYRPEGAGPFPVVLFSHGLGGSREGGRLWGNYWAEHGLMAIHLQHPGSDQAVWQEAQGSRFGALKSAASAKQLQARVADVRFTLDELARRKAGKDPLAVLADTAHVGMSGHSFGAVTTQSVAGERFPLFGARMSEPRLVAFLAFSPSARGNADASFGAIERPFFSITGTEDADPLGSGLTPADRLKPFAAMPKGGKYLLLLTGRNHMFFGGDHAAVAGSVEARQQALVMQTSLAFWRATLQGDEAARAWLRDGAIQQAGAAEARLESK